MRVSLLIVLALLVGVVTLPSPAADLPEPTAKELSTSQNNLKQIALAFHSYNDRNNRLPGNICTKDGKPLLSWRVAILPFINEEKLYKEFKLDEAWDSDANKKLAEKLPKVYAPVRVKAKAGETFYQTFVGKNLVFAEKGSTLLLQNIPDGTSNTAMVVEAGDPVIWTKPADLPFDLEKPLPKLGGLFDGVFHLALCDGSVIRVKKDFDVDEMKKVIMPADGNAVNLKALTGK